MTRAMILLALVLSACAPVSHVVPDTKVEIQRVEVPVPTPRAVPDEVLRCAGGIAPPSTAPSFHDVPGGILIYTADIPALYNTIRSEAEGRRQAIGCDDGWRAWATSP